MDFRLPQIVATIEKLDSFIEQVFKSESESDYLFSLNTFLNFVDEDLIIKYIFSLFKGNVSTPDVDEWFKKNSQISISISSGIGLLCEFEFGGKKYDFPQKSLERIVFLYEFLRKVVEKLEADVDKISNSRHVKFSTRTCQNHLTLIKKLVYFFQNDLRAMLVDLRVKAELSDSKDVKEPQIVNVIMGGTNQVNQANNLNDSSNINQN